MLELRSFGARGIVRDVDIAVRGGEFVGLIGPNGAGKTTLLRAALGLIPSTGFSSLAALSARERARAAAYMPQGREIAWPMPVGAVVSLGQSARAGDAAIARLDLEHLRHRPVTELSGGEQARVLLARALTQGAPLLMADEPIAGLDPAAQLQVMELFAQLAAGGGGVVASIHDLGLAVRHCTRLIVMDGGRIVVDGGPDILTPDLLARVFGIRAYFARTPDGAVFQPLSRV